MYLEHCALSVCENGMPCMESNLWSTGAAQPLLICENTNISLVNIKRDHTLLDFGHYACVNHWVLIVLLAMFLIPYSVDSVPHL